MLKSKLLTISKYIYDSKLDNLIGNTIQDLILKIYFYLVKSYQKHNFKRTNHIKTHCHNLISVSSPGSFGLPTILIWAKVLFKCYPNYWKAKGTWGRAWKKLELQTISKFFNPGEEFGLSLWEKVVRLSVFFSLIIKKGKEGKKKYHFTLVGSGSQLPCLFYRFKFSI